MNLVLELINGLKFGLEYVAADAEMDDDEDVNLIVFDLAFLRFIFVIPR